MNPAAPPVPVSRYAEYQRIIPGLESLYEMARAILDSSLESHARILVLGAGGGGEIAELAASRRQYWMTGVDPSSDMLELARKRLQNISSPDRIDLIEGTVDQLEGAGFSAALSLMVMQSLPDDGSKSSYLGEIRERLRPGATYIHADVTLNLTENFERIAAAVEQCASTKGLDADLTSLPRTRLRTRITGTAPYVIGENRTLQLLKESGFELVTPFFRGLWYAGWWCKAI